MTENFVLYQVKIFTSNNAYRADADLLAHPGKWPDLSYC